MVATFDIELQRNGSYIREWTFTDDTPEKAPLDLTAATFALDVKYAAGDPDPPLASATVTVQAPATGGRVVITLLGTQFNAVPGVKETVRLAFDLIATQSAQVMPLVRGTVILNPGVS